MNKLIIISGASRGIGLGIARHLLDTGFKVALCYNHHPEKAIALVHEYPKHAFAIGFDVGNKQAITDAFHKVKNHFNQPIYGIINNAGIAQHADFLTLSLEDWQHMLHINLTANFLMAQAALPEMLEQKQGRLIQISSVSGVTGGVYQPHYAAAKAGQLNLTKSLARLYSNQGITANAIAIGLIETDMLQAEMAKPEFSKRLHDIPAKRLGQIAEAASLAHYLLSPAASYITGQTLHLNGGSYCG
ncbi:MAG: SDR family NAD(P)-dependent oxidoreductase [Alphaproteobacteria bacterium]